MKNLYLLIFIFFLSLPIKKLQAQNWWDWSVPTGSVYYDNYDPSPISITIDRQNNFLLLNSTEICKYNRDGILKWKKGTMSDSRGICTDDSGNIYVNAKFEANGGMITKLDADSNIIWSMLRQKYTTYRNVVMSNIYVAPDGDVYVAGYFDPYGGVAWQDSLYWGNTTIPLWSSSAYYHQFIIAKINRFGAPQWFRMLYFAKSYSVQNRRPRFYSIVKDNSSNIYITGDLADGALYLDHDTIPGGPVGTYAGFVMQVNDNNGNVKWAKGIQPFSNSFSPNAWTLHAPCFAALHGTNGILLAGSDGYLTRPAGQNIWNPSGYIISYDTAGNEIWKKHLPQGMSSFPKKGNVYYSWGADTLNTIDSAGNFIKRVRTYGITNLAVSPVDETIGATSYTGNFCKVLLNSNKVSGYVFRDANRNGIKDSLEKGIANVLIGEAPNRFISISNYDGYYECYIDSGSHIISPLSDVSYNTYLPAAGYSVNFTGYGDTATNKNFAYAPMTAINDLEITTTPISPARPGFTSLYSTRIKNAGTETATGTANIKLPLNATYIADTNYITPVYTSPDSIVFDFSNLQHGEEKYFAFRCQLSSSLVIGNRLTFYSSVLPVANDTVPSDNFDTLIQQVRGSYDPNDKMVFPDGNLSLVEKNKPLSYTIRFQNTGNDTAFNVHLIDTLSEKLDIATLEMVGSSHPYIAKIEKGNVLHFYFDNINLIDSFHNEALSHGYIRFKIKPAVAINTGDEILNNASIYFDFNKPVVTNTTSTRYFSGVLPIVLKSFAASKNAVTVQLNFVTETENSLQRFEIERSSNGNTFGKIAAINAKGYGSSYQYTDTHPFTSINFYRLKLLFADGSFTYSATQAVQMKTMKGTIVFPNPANNTLFFTAASSGQYSYKIYSVDGRLHFAGYSSSIQTGSVISVNTSPLAPGNYYLEIINTSGREIKQFVIK